MANTNIGFTINIEGISSIEDLNKEIKKTNQELKEAEVGTEKYAATSEKLAKLKAEQKALRKQQTELTKSFLEQSNALGAYDKASAKLNRLRKEFKNLAIEGKASSKEGKALREEIQKLDKELKSTDSTVGQFQRNVGNYPRVFGISGKAIIKQFPILDKFSQKLDKATGGSNVLAKALTTGFLAFKAGKLLVDAFKQFDELIKKVDEVRNSVSALSGAGGEDLDKLTASVTALSTTFAVDAEQVNKSAAALSQELGISFEEALTKIETGLLAGVESNEEFLSSIEQAPAAFTEVSSSVEGYSSRQRELLEANKALAEAQVELTNTFSSSAGGIKTFATNAQTFLIKTLLAIVDAFKPVAKSVVDIGKGLGALIGSLFGAGDATKGFQSILEGVAGVLKITADTSLFFINSLRAGVDFIRGDASTAFKLFTKEGKALAQAEEQLAKTTKDLTSEFQNETKELNSLFGQLANTNKNTDERRKLIEKLNSEYGEYLPNIDLEKAGQEELALAYESTTKAIAQNLIDRKKIELQSKAANQFLEDNIRLEQARQDLLTSAEVVKARDESIKGVKSFAAALGEGRKEFRAFQKAQREFNEIQKEVNQNTEANKKEIELLDKASKKLVNTLSEFVSLPEAQAKAIEEAAQRAAKSEKDRIEEQKKLQEEANKAAIARAKKLQEQLIKEREKFLNGENKFLNSQIAILGKLQEKQEQLILKGITDIEEKTRKQAVKASEARIEQAQKEFNKLLELAVAREEEAAKLFGVDSEEFKKASEARIERVKKAEEEVAAITTRERIALTNELLNIEAQFLQKREQEAAAAFNKSISKEKQREELATSRLEERLAKGKITEEQFSNELFNIQRERIEKELQLIQQREKQIANSSTEAAKQENQNILLQKQNLYTELAKLDKSLADEQIKNQEEVTAKSKELSSQRLAQFQEDFNLIAEGFKAGLQVLTDLQTISDERRNKQIEEQEQQNQEQNQLLKDRLSNATGLEAQFLQQQITANESAAATIAKNKERIEKEQAKKAKARAIIESIIQTALAVVQALPNVPLSVIAGVTGAAATATIAAQPLATGGVVGALGSEIVQFNNGGKVTSKGNIKPLSNGDNVLATLKTGEVVLNEKQQQKIGGFTALRAAGVPNFAEGGLVGSPSSLIQKTTTLEADSKSVLSKLEAGIASTNERIDRIQVLWTSETQVEQDKGLKDRDLIKANATF
jgi:hypothetical protein